MTLFVQLIQLRQQLQVPSVLRRLVAGVLGRRIDAYTGAQKYVPVWRHLQTGISLCVVLRELLRSWAPRQNRDAKTGPDSPHGAIEGGSVSQDFVAGQLRVSPE